jgi:beta-lactam-binding protein with PASTA domain
MKRAPAPLLALLALAVGAWAGPSAAEPVSAAARTVTVPGLSGVKSAAAKQRLAALGLRVSIRIVASTRPAGTVVAQRPAAHTVVPRGTIVRLSVASATPAKVGGTVAVPDVIGQEQEAAQQHLGTAGLTSSVAYAHSLELVGTVIAQAPSAGEAVAKGALVTITLSSGPGP